MIKKRKDTPFDLAVGGQELNVKSMSRGGYKKATDSVNYKKQIDKMPRAEGLHPDGAGSVGLDPNGDIIRDMCELCESITNGDVEKLQSQIFTLPMFMAGGLNKIIAEATNQAEPYGNTVFYYDEETNRIAFQLIMKNVQTGEKYERIVYRKSVAGCCLFYEVLNTMGSIEDKKGNIYSIETGPMFLVMATMFRYMLEAPGQDNRSLLNQMMYKAGVAWATIHYTKSSPEEICDYVEELTDIF